MMKQGKLILFLACTLNPNLNLAISRALFSHTHNLQQALVDMINGEKKSIRSAIFIISEKHIIQALVNAAKRNVDIEIVIDKINLARPSFSKLDELVTNGVKISYYKFDYNPIITPVMHNKYCIFGCNADDKPMLWTGSFNFTFTASHYNKENAMIIHDTVTINAFAESFEKLKENCKPLAENRKYKKWKTRTLEKAPQN